MEPWAGAVGRQKEALGANEEGWEGSKWQQCEANRTIIKGSREVARVHLDVPMILINLVSKHYKFVLIRETDPLVLDSYYIELHSYFIPFKYGSLFYRGSLTFFSWLLHQGLLEERFACCLRFSLVVPLFPKSLPQSWSLTSFHTAATSMLQNEREDMNYFVCPWKKWCGRINIIHSLPCIANGTAIAWFFLQAAIWLP